LAIVAVRFMGLDPKPSIACTHSIPNNSSPSPRRASATGCTTAFSSTCETTTTALLSCWSAHS